uniref:Multiple EGF-like-domains 6b n=1 Tax=Scophthalmus maximus TaxID=52904 RepID=A0A8D3EBW1_SCOMX
MCSSVKTARGILTRKAFLRLYFCSCSRPNVCLEREVTLVAHRQPCVQAFTRMVKVWKQGCVGQSWCMGYERRTAYYTAYRQVYRQDYETVYKCCPGWSQLNGEAGCLYHVNECEETNGGCEALCCNTIGSFYCRCPSGQILSEDGKTCRDIDECQVHNGGCQHRCVNTRGSYYCECLPGSRLHVDGRTCLAVHSCAISNGGCEHYCVQQSAAHFRCRCKPNYVLAEDGKHCKLQNPCADQNGGCMHACRVDGGKAHCDCKVGYILAEDGKTCEDIDECELEDANCAHGCHNTLGSYACVCNTAYELGSDGKQCYRIEMEIVNSCENNNGGCSHHCQHSTGGPVCSCNHGYRLDDDLRTCVDVDECGELSSCCEQDCTNYPGGYECYCSAGYRLNSDGCSCDDVDECLAGNGGCDHSCQNSAGSFQCFCRRGFRLDEDRQSCIPLEDAVEALSSGGPIELPLIRPQLTLLQDYSQPLERYDDYEDDEGELRAESNLAEKFVCLDDTFGNDCSLTCDDCSNGGKCNVWKNGCDCPDGWTGIVCNQTCSEGHFGKNCSFHCKCKNGANCDPVTGSCRCPPGVSGDLCQDGCPKGSYGKQCNKKCNCANNGRCHRTYGACLCDPGLYGRFCHLPCPKWTFGPGCSDECHCVQQNTVECHRRHGTCTCKPGYQGNACKEELLQLSLHGVSSLCPPLSPECDPGTYGVGCERKCSCPPGVSCDHVTGKCQRKCPAGRHGENCDQGSVCQEGFWGPGCRDTCPACENGGSCDKHNGSCNCPPGFMGRLCQNSCLSGRFGQGCQMKCVCENNAHCDPVSGRCTCAPGWTGHNCRKVCDAGHWGVDCAGTCDCRNGDGSCDAVTGQCNCEAGYTGARCHQKCPAGMFGLGCRHRCQCDNKALCDHVSGACTCQVGWTGTFCEKHMLLTGRLNVCVCVSACPQGFYGLDCQEKCLCLNGGSCDHVSGVCSCPAGWIGPFCNLSECPVLSMSTGAGIIQKIRTCWSPCCGLYHFSRPWNFHFLISRVHGEVTILFVPLLAACPAGFYGEACNQTCGCGNNGACHPASGQCVCPPGWTGPKCTEGEFYTTEGRDHHMRRESPNVLPQNHLHWIIEMKSHKHHNWGTFDQCVAGRFGADCQQQCECENGGQCDRQTGRCGCRAGWIGELCEKGEPGKSLLCACEAGRFGSGCEERCRCSHGVACHHVTGECQCPPGWRGKLCDKGTKLWSLLVSNTRVCVHALSLSLSLSLSVSLSACLPGTFGQNCNHVCQCSETNQLCHPVSGSCYCAPGFQGPKCEQGT